MRDGHSLLVQHERKIPRGGKAVGFPVPANNGQERVFCPVTISPRRREPLRTLQRRRLATRNPARSSTTKKSMPLGSGGDQRVVEP